MESENTEGEVQYCSVAVLNPCLRCKIWFSCKRPLHLNSAGDKYGLARLSILASAAILGRSLVLRLAVFNKCHVLSDEVSLIPA